ncbi:hypothetical protein FRC03_006381 [Tulasnella sp. 419]|nr:hypothetical protein FRC03_006381 [Tulasnella sp. 419]
MYAMQECLGHYEILQNQFIHNHSVIDPSSEIYSRFIRLYDAPTDDPPTSSPPHQSIRKRDPDPDFVASPSDKDDDEGSEKSAGLKPSVMSL